MYRCETAMTHIARDSPCASQPWRRLWACLQGLSGTVGLGSWEPCWEPWDGTEPKQVLNCDNDWTPDLVQVQFSTSERF
jgi:hypothetical protein